MINNSLEKNKVSVIIPTYNRAKYIKRAVNSVVSQTYSNIEIIIVDDNLTGSDDSIYIHKEIVKLDTRILIVKTDGKVGGGKARNIGVENSSGNYLAFLDDDDIYLPEKIQKQLFFMLENNYEMSIQDIEWYDEKEKLIEHRTFEYIDSDIPKYMLKQHILHHLAPTAIYMITKEAFQKTDGFGETSMGQDWRLMLSCCINGLRIGYMQGVYVHQYLHSGERISLGKNKIEGENALYEIKKQYFDILETHEKRYVKFRHYAVLLFAYIRSKRYFHAIPCIIITLIISPKNCFLETQKYFHGRKL